MHHDNNCKDMNMNDINMMDGNVDLGYAMPEEFDFDNFEGCHAVRHQTFDCGRDQQVIRHQHVVRHHHDIINEYDVVHEHSINQYDVVKHREVVKNNDFRTHCADYCNTANIYDDGNQAFEAMHGRHHHGGMHPQRNCCRRRFW